MADSYVTRTRLTYHHGNLRPALIKAALRILRRNGIEGLTLRGVARVAGVSQAAPYKHFTDKSALLAAVAAAGFAELQARFEQVSSDTKNARHRLHRFGQAYVLFALDEPALFRLMFSAALGRLKHQHPDLIVAGARPYETMRKAVEIILPEAGVAQAEVDAACAAAWSLVHGLSMLLIDRRIDVTSDAAAGLIEAVTGLFVRGLSPGAEASLSRRR